MVPPSDNLVKLALPKGRMQQRVFDLLSDAGVELTLSSRGYRPRVSLEGFDAKILKPQNALEMLHAGTRDIGFGGADWVRELDVNLVELLDLGFDPVRLVAAAPAELLEDGRLPTNRPLVIASEYERITRAWIAKTGLNAEFVLSRGATEVFPPDDADCIVDVTQSGDTLRANGLSIVTEIMRSTTRLWANPRSLENPVKRDAIERFVLLLRSVLDARGRVMVEVNVEKDKLESVIAVLPSMRRPTISMLGDESGYAVKVAAPRETLAKVIPEIRARGGTDIVVTEIARLVP
ncbi:MAG: ATP phosphoribosyltransferase [Planctomycetota bacterium]|nr:MAG: ATP phosphoribosyltransferase [Planctomycetota bacterium]